MGTGMPSAEAGSGACSLGLVMSTDVFEPVEAQVTGTGHAQVHVEDAPLFCWPRLFSHVCFCPRPSVTNSDFHRVASPMASEAVHANSTATIDRDALCF